MIITKDFLDFKIEYPLKDPEKTIIFDIETTGLSGKYCNVYLIGFVAFSGDKAFYTQYMAENFTEEADLLSKFSAEIKNYNTFITFNGDTFDIPFLKLRANKHGIGLPLQNTKSIDLYRLLSPYSQLLGMENQKQKSYEKLLNIYREDVFSGGDLIEVFKEYVETKDEKLLYPLLLHNKEDILNLYHLVPLLTIPDFFGGKYSIVSKRKESYTNFLGNRGYEINFKLSLPSSLPVNITARNSYISLTAKSREAVVSVGICSGEKKYFYKNYRDYYYLPAEDKAIHKSLGTFVDKSFRQQAKASNCYEKIKSDFIPVFDKAGFDHTFYDSYNGQAFIRADDLSDDNVKNYINSVLTHVL